MDRGAAVLAIVLGAPPGVGMGLALLSVTRGDAFVASIVVGVGAGAVLPLIIYFIATRGMADEATTGPDQLS